LLRNDASIVARVTNSPRTRRRVSLQKTEEGYVSLLILLNADVAEGASETMAAAVENIPYRYRWLQPWRAQRKWPSETGGSLSRGGRSDAITGKDPIWNSDPTL
jgi:hypothetical protein